MNRRIQVALGGIVLGWCLLAAVSSLLNSVRRGPDPMAALDAEFAAFAAELPPGGVVGFLEPYEDWSEADVRMHYAAQYALAPRVVVRRVGPDFVIVARGMARPDGDPRLSGYYPIASVPGGHRLFWRLER